MQGTSSSKCPDILPVPLHKVIFLIKVTGSMRKETYLDVPSLLVYFCLFGDLLFINFII